jgi:glucosyl-dolichyl phosphate glucuronosyltransferase
MLEDTVRSVLSCERPAGCSVDLLVVDNASTDDTRVRMVAFEESGQLRYLYEPQPGLAHARNAGIDASDGDWVIFLDDDVILDSSFLLAYAQAFANHPEVSFWGGAVLPVFEDAVADWVSSVNEAFPWCFSALRMDGPTRLLSADQYPFGANMCVHRKLLHQQRFSDNFGFSHGNLVPGEETAFFRHAQKLGFLGGFVAEAPVQHRMPASRARLTTLIRRCYGQGIAEARSAQEEGRSSRWAVRALLSSLATAPLALVRGAGARAVTLLRCVHYAGLVVEASRIDFRALGVRSH